MSSVFDPGKSDRKRARKNAEKGVIEGGGISGPGGISAGFDFSNNRSTVSSSLGDFAPLLDQLIGGSQGFFDQANAGLPPELRSLGEQTIGNLGQSDFNRLTNESGFNRAGEAFRRNLDFANRDVFDVGDEISSRLRGLSERRNQRHVNKMFDRLQRTGNLTSSAGIQRAGDEERNLFEQGLQFDLAGLQFGQGELARNFQQAMQAGGLQEQIGQRQFGEDMGINQFNNQAALQQFGVGSSMFDQFLQSQQQGTQLGLATMAGGTALSQLPLQFLAASQNAATLGSNSRFAQAGVDSQNAANAGSPFLDALTAAGGFATGLGDLKTAIG